MTTTYVCDCDSDDSDHRYGDKYLLISVYILYHPASQEKLRNFPKGASRKNLSKPRMF